jgi:hypothetical protein
MRLKAQKHGNKKVASPNKHMDDEHTQPKDAPLPSERADFTDWNQLLKRDW